MLTTVFLRLFLLVQILMSFANAKQGVTFCIHGVMYHSIGQLLAKDNEAPKYAQIYFHVGIADVAVENRMHHLEDASLPELRLLQMMKQEINPYVTFFRQGIEVMSILEGITSPLPRSSCNNAKCRL